MEVDERRRWFDAAAVGPTAVKTDRSTIKKYFAFGLKRPNLVLFYFIDQKELSTWKNFFGIKWSSLLILYSETDHIAKNYKDILKKRASLLFSILR